MDTYLVDQALRTFLAEDLEHGDITGELCIPPDLAGQAVFLAREPLVAAGMERVAARVFRMREPSITYRDALGDGRRAMAGDVLLRLRGPVRELLAAERVALNLVQRLCGIATFTARMVEAVAGLPVKIADTRKTTPGLRMLEKYAVRVGGGANHRYSLSDGILIKDNHIAACGSVSEAVSRARRGAPHTLRIEVEAETLAQVEECLAAGVDCIMLDNMDFDTMRRAVTLVNGRAILEASGGVRLENVRAIAETGVDIISAGALTHSAPACDISMEMEGA